jgi:hypothetical protein
MGRALGSSNQYLSYSDTAEAAIPTPNSAKEANAWMPFQLTVSGKAVSLEIGFYNPALQGSEVLPEVGVAVIATWR